MRRLFSVHVASRRRNLIPRWLADIAGFDDVFIAREVPFLTSPETGREAGRIDVVVAGEQEAARWFGLEIQAVYFSGNSMAVEFQALRDSGAFAGPVGKRRPDWRSSSAKRLMPQLQVKAPTLRRWGTKIAVAVDRPFFDSMGGVGADYSHDPNDGDVLWLVPEISEAFSLERGHWEVLSLEESSDRLLSADMMRRADFETGLRGRLRKLD